MKYAPKSGEHIFETARAARYLARTNDQAVHVQFEGFKLTVLPADSDVEIVVRYYFSLQSRWRGLRDEAEKDAAEQIAKAEEKYGNPAQPG